MLHHLLSDAQNPSQSQHNQNDMVRYTAGTLMIQQLYKYKWLHEVMYNMFKEETHAMMFWFCQRRQRTLHVK